MSAPESKAPSETKKSGFKKGLMYFVLGVAVLMAMSTLLGDYLAGDLDGAKEKIAVVEVAGVISHPDDIVRQLRSYRKDPEIKGIILRIDSPGGAVGPSQEIYEEVVRVRNSSKRIFASMGSVAASGGYYIAAPTEKIFANPGTLTGSIGVIMGFSNVQGLMKKLGLKPEVVKAGKFKDTGSPARSMTKKERRYLQKVVDDVHEQFINAVAEGRDMEIHEARKVADGRIFTGRQAMKMNMVDEMGGLETAIEKMGQLLGADGRPKVVQEFPQPTLMDWLLQGKTAEKIRTSLLPETIPGLQFLWLPY